MLASVRTTPRGSIGLLASSVLIVGLVLAPVPSVSGSSANTAACEYLAQTLLPGVHNAAVPNAAVPHGVCASVFASGVGTARGLLALPRDAGLLTVDTNADRILFLRDYDGSGAIDQPNERVTLVTQDGLSHGLTLVNETLLLASSASTVYSWPFNLAQPNTPITAPATVFISDLTSGHGTHTLVPDAANSFLYIHAGSDGNIDTSTDRALIKRFLLTSVPSGGYKWSDGEVFVRGVRNEVGLAFDRYGVLWGVENGADRLERSDLGGDIHNTNPGEEVNKFDAPSGTFYGYPYCWSEYQLPTFGQGPTTQWAWPDFMTDGTHTDAWCRNSANVVRPQTVMAAHTAPLDLQFYSAKDFVAGSEQTPFALPSDAPDASYLYVAQHGSWNADPAVGYRVQRFRLTDSGSSMTLPVTTSAEDFFSYDSPSAQTGPGWVRPVNLAVGPRGELYISNDVDATRGNIIVLRFVVGFNSTDNSTTPSKPTSFNHATASTTLSSFILLFLTASWAALMLF